ncbi:hypothetical protein PAPYR_5164 [Paratrimastix pyriformis]|uniref:Uncharacterized protein n=1 Tax=Paratrimastix pyriformis TaxID=342808 RepID=A0ABQ8UMG9_9EUKA|nr:hypothetical protein PAPYR_5164 [Paratrimastix pyriformis]
MTSLGPEWPLVPRGVGAIASGDSGTPRTFDCPQVHAANKKVSRFQHSLRWSIQSHVMMEAEDAPSHSASSILSLPAELLANVTEQNGAQASMPLYIMFLGLCHDVRNRLKGVARILSLAGDSDDAPMIPSTALAALIGPCINLEVLHLSPRHALLCCGQEEEAFRPWVESAFQGHSALRTLRIPCTSGLSELALCQCLSFFPNLTCFEVGSPEHPCPYGDPLLTTLACFCPSLESASFEFLFTERDPNLSCLVQCPALRSLTLGGAGLPEDLLSSLPCLESLSFEAPDRVSFHPTVRAHLHTLRMPRDQIPPGAFPELAAVELTPSPTSSRGLLFTFLAQHHRTLTRVTLTGPACSRHRERLVETLLAFPRLDEVRFLEADWPDLPAGLWQLVGHLVRFELEALEQVATSKQTLRLEAPRLRECVLDIELGGPMFLVCPVLETIALPWVGATPQNLFLECPSLRTMTRLSPRLRVFGPTGALTTLTSSLRDPPRHMQAPALSAFGGLTRLEGVCITQADTLAGLLGGRLCPRLQCLVDLEVVLGQWDHGHGHGQDLNRWVVDLTPGLEELGVVTMEISMGMGPSGLVLRGTGLTRLGLARTWFREVTLGTPRLAALRLVEMESLAQVGWAEGLLRHLTLHECPGLLRHPSFLLLLPRIRTLAMSLPSSYDSDWHWADFQLAAALPSLCELRLYGVGAGPVDVRHPRLAVLGVWRGAMTPAELGERRVTRASAPARSTVDTTHQFVRLLLDCPALEVLSLGPDRRGYQVIWTDDRLPATLVGLEGKWIGMEGPAGEQARSRFPWIVHGLPDAE